MGERIRGKPYEVPPIRPPFLDGDLIWMYSIRLLPVNQVGNDYKVLTNLLRCVNMGGASSGYYLCNARSPKHCMLPAARGLSYGIKRSRGHP